MSAILRLLLQLRGLGPDPLHQVGGPRIALGPFGHDPDQPEVAGRVGRLLGDGRHPGELADVVGQILDHALRIGAGDDVGRHQQRRVVAGAELGGDQVEGGPLRRPELGAAVVGQGQGQVLGRERQHRDAGQDDDHGDGRHLGHEADPAGAHGLPARGRRRRARAGRPWTSASAAAGCRRSPAPRAAGSGRRRPPPPPRRRRPQPITLRNGIWATARPQSAMITVVPANTTADPAVARDWAIDSSTSIPVASCRRCRVTMNRP